MEQTAQTSKGYIIVIGTFLPVIGLYLTFFVAKHFPKVRRPALILGPVLTLIASLLLAKCGAGEGNIFFAILLAILVLFMCAYYPALGILAVIRFYRTRRTKK